MPFSLSIHIIFLRFRPINLHSNLIIQLSSFLEKRGFITKKAEFLECHSYQIVLSETLDFPSNF